MSPTVAPNVATAPATGMNGRRIVRWTATPFVETCIVRVEKPSRLVPRTVGRAFRTAATANAMPTKRAATVQPTAAGAVGMGCVARPTTKPHPTVRPTAVRDAGTGCAQQTKPYAPVSGIVTTDSNAATAVANTMKAPPIAPPIVGCCFLSLPVS